MQNKETKNKMAFELILITITIIFDLILKTFFFKEFWPIFLTTLFEILLFTNIFALSYFISFFSKVTSKIVFYILFIFTFSINTAASIFFSYQLDRQYSIYSLKLGDISFFLTSLGNIYEFIIIFISFFITTALIFHFTKKYLKIKLTKKQTLLIFIVSLFLILILGIIIPSNLIANGIYSSIHETKNILNEKTVEVNKQINLNIKNYLQIFYPKQPTKEELIKALKNTKYKRILMFAFETIPYNDYMQEIKENKNGIFYKAYNKIFFNNYFTTNQDSRTADMTMFSGFFVPYECYTYENWFNLYFKKVLEKPNLISIMNDTNYNTIYVISTTTPTAVGQYYPWKTKLTITDKEYNAFSKKYTCLHVLKYEKGCEDIVMFDKIKPYLHKNKIFLWQELIYGHDVQYLEINKKTRYQYYDEYITKIYNYLKDNNLLEGTLIILTSDHGPKIYNKRFDINTYHDELAIYGKDLPSLKINALASHLDFKNILYHVLKKDYNFNINRPFLFIIGTTGSNALAFINNKGYWVTFTLNPKTAVKKTNIKNQSTIKKIISLFYKYKSYFDKVK